MKNTYVVDVKDIAFELEIAGKLQRLIAAAFFERYVRTMNSIEVVRRQLAESREYFEKKVIEENLVCDLYEHQLISSIMTFSDQLKRLESLLKTATDNESVAVAFRYKRHLVEQLSFMTSFGEIPKILEVIDDDIVTRIDLLNALTVFARSI